MSDLEDWRSYLAILARTRVAPRLRGKFDASDVVQQTMLEAHQDRHKFRGTSDAEFAVWLRQILAHNLANMIRDFDREKRDVRRERSFEDQFEKTDSRLDWLAAAQSSPSQKADRRDQVLRLASAMMELPAEQRLAIESRYLDGWPLKQIATNMNRSSAAVAGLLHRGLEKLREKLRTDQAD